MQGFKAKIHLIWLFVLLVACTRADVTAVLPTPIIAAGGSGQPGVTPTLVSEHSAGSSLVAAAEGAESERSLGDSYIPELGNTGYDVQKYTLRLTLDPAVTYASGETVIEAVATHDNLSRLSLDFIGFDISQVQVGGTAVPFSREDGKLLVDLPQPVASGQQFEVVVGYAGQPVREKSAYVGFIDALGLQFVNGQTIFAVSEPDGARYWFPANDHPRDKALFRFEITVPLGFTAVANGRLVSSESNDETSTFIWEHNFPMATYLALVAVGHYQRIEAVSPGGIPLRHYAFTDSGDSFGSREDFVAAVSITGEAIDWMSQLFGPYPFEAFGFVAAEMPGASMETQTMVLLSSSMTGQRTAIHEIAHMWFGDWVSLQSWQEMWRNEGLATYVTMMWDHRGDPEGLDLEVAGALAAVAENDPQYPLGDPPPDYLFGYNTYFKGAALVHALRQEVGDEAFFAGLRTYIQRYGGAAASDADFKAVMEEVSGLSLDAFFNEWLN